MLNKCYSSNVMNNKELKNFLFQAREKKQWEEHCRKINTQEEYEAYLKEQEQKQEYSLKRPNSNQSTWWY